MSTETEAMDAGKSSDQPMEPLSWHQTWVLALTRPSVATFEKIAHNPNASSRRAYKWIFIAFLVGDLLSLSIEFTRDSSSTEFNCFLPLGAVAAVFFTKIYASIVQWIAKRLGGMGTFSGLVYAFASSLAPIALISTGVSFLAIGQFLVIPLFIYGLVLNALAVRAVHRLEWEGSAASILTPILLAIFLVAIPIVLVISDFRHSKSYELITNQDNAPFIEALAQSFEQKWNNDKSVPTYSFGIDTYGDHRQPTFTFGSEQQFSGEWLVIEFFYTGTCASTAPDPCNKLANEAAQIVFDDYLRMNDIDGIGIIIGNTYFDLTVPPDEIIFKKYLTIEEWRRELSPGK